VRILAVASLIEPKMRCGMLNAIGEQIRKFRARRGDDIGRGCDRVQLPLALADFMRRD
jgi:hypothetical protein